MATNLTYINHANETFDAYMSNMPVYADKTTAIYAILEYHYAKTGISCCLPAPSAL